MGRLLSLVLLGCFSGCATGHWDAAERKLCAASGCFTVGELPAKWKLIHQEESEVGFFDDSSSAVIQGNATCTADADAAPLATLTGHLLIGYTDRRVRSAEVVALDRREALRTILDARLDGVAIVLDLYVLKRNGCIYDLSLAAAPATYAMAEHDFAGFVAGFVGEKRL